jgi:glycosyltransferase involved in cell wall biosynthesis
MANSPIGGVRLLITSKAGQKPSDAELRRQIAAGEIPDLILSEDSLGASSLDERDLGLIPGLRGRIMRRLPFSIAMALEVWLRRRDFDVVLSWEERLAFPLAILLMLTPRRGIAHIGILMWPCYESPSRLKRWLRQIAYPLLARHGIDRLWVPAPLQRELVIARWGIPPERFVDAGYPVDTRFWHPMEGPGDTICSVGREMRDYGTLISALRTLDIPCHIASGSGTLQRSGGDDDPRASNVDESSLPVGVTIGSKSHLELRELYRRSRFVVIPVLPSETDNGGWVSREAMAMGRAVLATATAGRTELLEDGVNCLLVAPQDPDAMRAAIECLWNDPVLCARLAVAGRERVVAEYSNDVWIAAMRAAVADAVSARRLSARSPRGA